MKITIEVFEDGKIRMEKSEELDPITAAKLLCEGAVRMLAPFKAEIKEAPKIIVPKMKVN